MGLAVGVPVVASAVHDADRLDAVVGVPDCQVVGNRHITQPGRDVGVKSVAAGGIDEEVS